MHRPSKATCTPRLTTMRAHRLSLTAPSDLPGRRSGVAMVDCADNQGTASPFPAKSASHTSEVSFTRFIFEKIKTQHCPPGKPSARIDNCINIIKDRKIFHKRTLINRCMSSASSAPQPEWLGCALQGNVSVLPHPRPAPATHGTESPAPSSHGSAASDACGTQQQMYRQDVGMQDHIPQVYWLPDEVRQPERWLAQAAAVRLPGLPPQRNAASLCRVPYGCWAASQGGAVQTPQQPSTDTLCLGNSTRRHREIRRQRTPCCAARLLLSCNHPPLPPPCSP